MFIFDKNNLLCFLRNYFFLLLLGLFLFAPVYASEYVQTSSTKEGTLNVEISYESPLNGIEEIKINFINPQTHEIQEHIDYKVVVVTYGQIIFASALEHTSTGSALIPIEFKENGKHSIIILVEGILFQPIPIESALFDVEVSNESQTTNPNNSGNLQDIIERLQNNVNNGDLNKIMSMFSSTSVVVTPFGEFHGKNEIQELFSEILQDNTEIISLGNQFLLDNSDPAWDFEYTSDSLTRSGAISAPGVLSLKTENDLIAILSFELLPAEQTTSKTSSDLTNELISAINSGDSDVIFYLFKDSAVLSDNLQVYNGKQSISNFFEELIYDDFEIISLSEPDYFQGDEQYFFEYTSNSLTNSGFSSNFGSFIINTDSNLIQLLVVSTDVIEEPEILPVQETSSELFEELIFAINNKDITTVSNLFDEKDSGVVAPEGTFQEHDKIVNYFREQMSQNFQVLSFDGPYPVEDLEKYNVEYTNDFLTSINIESDTAEILVYAHSTQFQLFSFIPYDTFLQEGGELYPLTNVEFFYQGVTIFSIFIIILFISLIVMLIFLKKKIKIQMKTNRLSPIIPISLVVTFITIFFVTGTIYNAEKQMYELGAALNNYGFAQQIFAAVVLGIAPSIVSYFIFIRISKFITDQPYGLKILIMSTTFVFITTISTFVIYPLVNIILGSISIISKLDILSIRPWTEVLAVFTGHISLIFTLQMLLMFMVWIPLMMILYGIYEYKKSQKPKMLIKIIGLAIIFVAMAGPFIASNITTVSDEFLQSALFIQLSLPTIIVAFLAAEGYVGSIKTNLQKIRNPNASGTALKNVLRLTGAIVFIVGIISLAKNVLLIAPVTIDDTVSTSMVYTIFTDAVSSYALDVHEIEKDAAQFVYNSTAIFFSLFWMYDLLMVLRGFGKEFINSENVIFKKVRESIGDLTATSTAAFLIAIMIGSSTILNFKTNELAVIIPSWVNEHLQVGINIIEFKTVLGIINPIIGIATILGIAYFLIRIKKSKNAQNIVISTEGSTIKFCRKCGAEVDDKSKFCRKCGTEGDGKSKFCRKCGTSE